MGEKYDYYKALTTDITEYISENINLIEWLGKRDELEDRLLDDLCAEDSVTGNASGGYFFSTYAAEEAICHNLDLLADACSDYCQDAITALRNPEIADIYIRCYLLPEVLYRVMADLESQGKI